MVAIAIALVALWVEIRPDPTVDHPFATVAIHPGESVGDWNVEWKAVPVGLLDPVAPGSVAIHPVAAGNPILGSDIGDGETLIPQGWWTIEVEIGPQATIGERAMVVMLDTGTLARAVVVSASSDDPLGASRGAVAVEPDHAAEAAMAAAEGRLAVMFASG